MVREAISRVEAAVHAAGGTFKQTGSDIYRASSLCHGKLSDALMIFYKADEGRIKVYCHADCEYEAILAALNLPKSALYDEPRSTGSVPLAPRPQRPKPVPVTFDPAPLGWKPPADQWMPCGHGKAAEYIRTDEHGAILYAVARCPQKCLRHWRPTPQRPHRRWRLDELDQNHDVIGRTRRVPYRLPYIVRAVEAGEPIWLCEGEKDAITALKAFGVTSTSSKNWRPDFNQFFDGADIVICADRDAAGERIAKGVVTQLLPVARSIEVVQAATGNDLTDHVEAGGHLGGLVTVWEPKPVLIGAS